MQRRSTVEHHRVFVDHLFEDIPHHRFLIVHHLLGALNRGGKATGFELIEDEGLKELKRHKFGQTALMQTQFRPHRNHGAPRVVNTLTQEVLTEAAGLTLDHVGKRLQRALVGTGHRLTAAAVIEEAVDGFLQHALFIAHDDVRGLKFQEALQAVVTVDDAAVKVIQIRGRKAAAVQRNERAQIRRQHRQHLKNHPLGLDAGALEALENLQTLGDLLDLGVRTRCREFLTQVRDFLINVDARKELTDGFSAHHGLEVIAVLGEHLDVFVFREKLPAGKRREARVGDAVGFKVKHAFDIAERNIEHHTHARRQAL